MSSSKEGILKVMNYYKAYFLTSVAVVTLLGLLLTARFAQMPTSRNALNQQDTLDIAQFQWKNRLILAFADEGYTTYNRQLAMLRLAIKALEEREVIVFSFFEEMYVANLGESLPPSLSKAYRQHFDIEKGKFTILLIGKDGGVKLKKDSLVSTQVILDLIDSMPMRQQEMKKN